MAGNTIRDYLEEFPNFLSLFVFSFFMGAISPILIDIGNFFGANPQDVNLVTSFFMAGTVLGIITATVLNRFLDKGIIVIAAYLALIPTMVFLSTAKTLKTFYLLYCISGLFLGIAWLQANTSMVEGKVKNKDSVVNLGHAFFAIGALISPFVSSYFLQNTKDWKNIYYVMLALIITAMIFYISLKRKIKIRATTAKSTQRKEFFSKSKVFFLILSVFMVIFYMIAETITFSWSPTFFRLDKFFTVYQAGLILSIFWIGMLAGRISISFIVYKVKSDIILIILCAISIFSILLAVLSNNRTMVFLGIGLTGLGFSGIIPLMISTGTEIFAEKKDIVILILFSLGLMGNSLGPYIAKVSSNYNLRFSVIISAILVFLSLVLLIIRMIFKKTAFSSGTDT